MVASSRRPTSPVRSWLMSSMAAFAIAVAIDEAGCSSDDAVVENIGVGSTQEQQLTSDNRGDPARTGVYYDEAGLLTPQNVGSDGGFVETPTRYQVDGPIYAQPLIVPSVPIGVGSTDLLSRRHDQEPPLRLRRA